MCVDVHCSRSVMTKDGEELVEEEEVVRCWLYTTYGKQRIIFKCQELTISRKKNIWIFVFLWNAMQSVNPGSGTRYRIYSSGADKNTIEKRTVNSKIFFVYIYLSNTKSIGCITIPSSEHQAPKQITFIYIKTLWVAFLSVTIKTRRIGNLNSNKNMIWHDEKCKQCTKEGETIYQNGRKSPQKTVHLNKKSSPNGKGMK